MSRRLRFLRARNVIALSAITGFLAACGFGVDLDGIFGGGAAVDPRNEAGADGPTAPDAMIPKVPVVQLGVGDEFACGRRTDGTVMCWGAGYDGRLGDNQQAASSQPVLVRDITDAVDLSVGDDHACIVRRDGTVMCWGQNDKRQIGDGSNVNALTPKPVVGLADVAQVIAGGEFTCALKKAGDVFCWGENGEGLVGNGVAGADVLTPIKVPDLVGVTSLGNGPTASHFCAVLGSGEARCWGDANAGQIGHAKGEELVNKPTAVVALTDAAKITMGNAFTCVLRRTGGVSCWGTNGWRQLGVGDSNPPGGTNTPVPIDGLTGIDQVAAGNDFACALHSGGEKISCWGSNRSGSLGRATRIYGDLPLKVNGFAASSVGLGRHHTCATTPQGAIWCWGFNNLRQHASSAVAATGTPTLVTAVSGAQRMVGGEIHTCGLFGTEVKCWGHGQTGALGHGSSPYIQTDPVTLNAGAPVKDLGAGYHLTCVHLDSNEMKCTGNNDEGRLGSPGNSTNTPRTVLVPNPAAADAGTPDAGDPDAGDDGGIVDAGPPPPSFIAFSDVQKMGIGRIHSCAVHGGGKVSCWGTPWDGRLGINTGTPRSTPIAVNLPLPATDVACGWDHTCAVLDDGSIRCWGANYSGQLSGGGDNGAAQRTPNLNGKQAKAITAGASHTCALLTDGTVACWGRGKEGQLGHGFRADANQPQPVKDLAGVVALDADEYRTCAIVTDGSLYCWGDNSAGALGDGVVMVTGVPGSVSGY